MKYFSFVLICIGFLILGSCKKDSPAPAPAATALNVKNTTVDAQKGKTTYSGISTNPTITVSFSQPLDETTVSTNLSFTLNGLPVPTTLTFSNSDSTVTIKPTAALHAWSTYNLNLMQDLASKSKIKFNVDVAYHFITAIDPTDKFKRISDDQLLDSVQVKTLKYFYDFGHEASGMARERNTSGNTVTTGGSGFGIMALIAGVNRGFIPRPNGIARFNKIVTFLETADRFHGAWPHWLDGNTGKVIPFSTNDDGADLVETSYMAQGLITLREYLKLTPADTAGNNLINRLTNLYNTIEWSWFRQEDKKDVLYWHWSPDKAWIMNFPLSGYFEEQITYVMAASSPTWGIPKIVYTHGYGQDGAIATKTTFTYNSEAYLLPLGSPSPLFWTQYSYLGKNPHFSDDFADYWTQNVNAARIDHAYCVQNPKHYYGYSDSCWGLTASDTDHGGYNAQSPENDNGTISPTAALSSFPYTPDISMKALQFFYYTMGDHLWGPYGFYDAIDLQTGWTADSFLAIDQGPIIVMIENYRSQLLWNLFESAPEVKAGEQVLGLIPDKP